jgi:fumarate hydratase, class II
MTAVRIESDTMGTVAVPQHRYWGAQTERARTHFPMGRDGFVWSRTVVRALGLVKRCAAEANDELGVLPWTIASLIERAAAEVGDGAFDADFPLGAFQSGSGTQTNMNANEVIANRANEFVGMPLGSKRPVHPNDHVNRGQSSNDVFPTVMHVAVVEDLRQRLCPAVARLRSALDAKAREFSGVVKGGRTHLQDATPLTLGQEMSAWVAQLDDALAGIRHAETGLHAVAIGGTAVGTGLNTHARFGELVASCLASATGVPFRSADNKFAALACHDALVTASAALRTLAGALMKIANDVRWLASGPRTGLGELRLPANEPGSSIMPGKVNPTQCEAITMVAVQVFGNDATVAFAGSQGHFQLNVFKPIMLHNVLESVNLLADGCDAFTTHCVVGLGADLPRIRAHLEASLAVATALTPAVGYDAAARVAAKAAADGTTVKTAALALGMLSAEELDRLLDPATMIRPAG